MNYAIIDTGGKQYKATVGGILEIEKIDSKPGDIFKFDKVLLVSADGKCDIGRPLVDNATVSGKVLENFKGEKIRVSKFKAKARYRKVTGHRQILTRIQITDISSSQPLPAKKSKEVNKTKES